jgi:hypothetical protein
LVADLAQERDVPMKGLENAPEILFVPTATVLNRWEAELQEFTTLELGWDSYNAQPPSALTIEAARGFLAQLQAGSLQPVAVDPSVVGGVGITFRHENHSVYLEFRNTGNAHAAFLGESKPRVVKVTQDTVGYQEFLREAKKHLYEQNAPDARGAQA